MRTTLRIDDDVYQAVRGLAAYEGRPVGEVVSDLLRRSLAPSPSRPRRGGRFPTFTVARRARPITPEMVKRALEEP